MHNDYGESDWMQPVEHEGRRTDTVGVYGRLPRAYHREAGRDDVLGWEEHVHVEKG